MSAPIIRSPSLQTINQDCEDIATHMKALELNEARAKVRQVYEDGLKAAFAEVQGKPLIKESVYLIMEKLGDILFSDATANQRPLQRSMIKTYRLFVELTWFQSCRFGSKDRLVVKDEYVDEIKKKVEEAIASLPKENAVNSKFQLQCIEEACKSFYLMKDNVWKKFLRDAPSLIGSAAELKVGSLIGGIVDLFRKADAHMIAHWYQDTYLWRWQTTEVKTLEAFNNALTPNDVIKAKKEGDKYTVCLALIFMSVIKNKSASKTLQDAVFEGIKQLLNLEKSDTASDYVAHPEEVWKIIARKPDRFWKSRLLAMQYLKRLAIKEKYKEFQEESRKALNERAAALKEKVATCYMDEKDQLMEKLADLKRYQEDLTKRQFFLEEKIMNAGLSTRGGSEPGDPEKDESDLKEVDSKIAEIEEDVKLAQEGLSRVEKIHTDGRDEMGEISAILKSIKGV